MPSYTVTEVDEKWEARKDGELIGRRPKKDPAKHLCQLTAGRRRLDWDWDAKTRTYTADAS
jgi:hypothetical protein